LFFSDYAFLCVEEYFHAMCVCLQAVEQNRVTLLAELDVSLVSRVSYCCLMPTQQFSATS